MQPRMGISLRQEWIEPLLASSAPLPAVEVIFEQWMFATEAELQTLERIRARQPLLLHCLSMNLGSTDPLDRDYFERIRAFADRFELEAISDHLSWRSIDGRWALSLLPMPRTEEALSHLASRVDAVQSFLGRTIALENVSQYLPTPDDLSLVDMFNGLAASCASAIHLDLNNLLVNERWLGEAPEAFLDRLDADIAWIHVAGHQDVEKPIDDHSAMPSRACLRLLDSVPTEAPVILEWDRERPSFDALVPRLTETGASDAAL
jgi:uncharacterized protein (UPF0276 family)